MRQYILQIPAVALGAYIAPELEVVFRRSINMIGMEVLYVQYSLNGDETQVKWEDVDPTMRQIVVLSINAFRQGMNQGRKRS